MPNSHNFGQYDHLVLSNLAQGLYTKGWPEHLLIPCGVLDGIILAPNHPASLKKLGRAFPWPKLSTWTGLGSTVG